MRIYMVEVNAKFLIKVEIDGSCAAAEHFFLDNFKGVWAANAYDEKGMKTDCFRGAILNSEIISFSEFELIMMEMDHARLSVAALEKKEKELSEI